MKNRDKEMSRIISLIENERLSLKGNFEELLSSDILRVLKDYFDLSGSPEITITKNEKKYTVSINIDASGIKCFNSIPDYLD